MRVVIGIVCVGVIFCLAVVLLYWIPTAERTLAAVSRYVPLPAVCVEKACLRFYVYKTAMDGWRQYVAVERLSVEEGVLQERVVSQLKRDLAIEMLLSARGATGEVDGALADLYAAIIEQSGSEAVALAYVHEQFGWTQEELERYVLRPSARIRALDARLRAEGAEGGVEDALSAFWSTARVRDYVSR